MQACSVISNQLTRDPTQRVRAKMLMILEAKMQMQCYDAMRDLRVKIRVLQMPLFKVILAGEVKVQIFVSRGRMGLNNNKETNFGP